MDAFLFLLLACFVDRMEVNVHMVDWPGLKRPVHPSCKKKKWLHCLYFVTLLVFLVGEKFDTGHTNLHLSIIHDTKTRKKDPCSVSEKKADYLI